VPTSIGGTAYYSFPLVDPSPSCDTPGTATIPPEDTCKLGVRGAIGVTYWTHHSTSRRPNVYVLNDFDLGNALTCAGGPFDFRNLDVDGPACIAARAVDAVGNVGVSEVVAVCVDRDGIGDECDAFDAEAVRASCTDGCLPREFANTITVIRE
jgi:hypothetical protein